MRLAQAAQPVLAPDGLSTSVGLEDIVKGMAQKHWRGTEEEKADAVIEICTGGESLVR